MKRSFLLLTIAVIFMFSVASSGFSDPLDSWTARTACTSDNLKGIAYGNGVFVAVGGSREDGGIICISEDGQSWTEASDSPIEEAYLNAVVFGNNIFVAVGDGGAIFTSSDGDEWTKRTSNTNYSLSGVTFGNGKFIAVGYGHGAMILTSTNGIAWTNVYPESCNLFDPCEWMFTVGYGGGKFFAAGWSGSNTYVLTSSDGNSWSKLKLNGLWYFKGAAFGNSKYIASGGYCYNWGSCNGILFTSSNGTAWSQFDFGDSFYPRFRGATFKKGAHVNSFVIVGEDGIILTSPDAAMWTPRTSRTTENLNDVIYGRRTFVAVGDEGTILQSGVFPAQLTVIKTGSGSGTVTSDPAGINCGLDCTENYNTEFNITLTANEAIGSVFAGWTGCTSNPTVNTCYVNLDDDKTITARFDSLGPCSVRISPSRARLTAAGGVGSFNVTAPAFCSWTVSSSAAWVTVAPLNGTGNGTINYTVVTNDTGSSRSANITVQSGSSSRNFRVRQSR